MKRWLALFLLSGFLVLLLQATATATLKFKRETGKSCLFCHQEVPEKGSKDPKLNDEGEKFKANGYRLTEEQKKKPSPTSGRN